MTEKEFVELLRTAVRKRDVNAARLVAKFCVEMWGYDDDQTWELVNHNCPISQAAWEGMVFGI